MRYKGEVNMLQDTGESVKVKLANVVRMRQPEWDGSYSDITIMVPHAIANKAFKIGRQVSIRVDVK